MKITPITEPRVDWGFFIDSMIEMTGRSPTRQPDSKGLNLREHRAYLESLSDFSKSNGEFLLHHLHFAFLVEIEPANLIEIIKKTNLKTVDNHATSDRTKLAIISGSVYEYKEACLEFCTESSSPILRFLFDWVYIYLHNARLLTLLKSDTLPDQTFALEDMR